MIPKLSIKSYSNHYGEFEETYTSSTSDAASDRSFDISPTKFKNCRDKRISNIKNSLSLVRQKKDTVFIKTSIFDHSDELQIFSTKNFNNHYILMQKLGEGGSAVVRKVLSKVDGEYYAAKIIRTRDIEYLTSIKNEYLLLKKLNHSNIVKAYDLIFDEENGFVYIILEYFEGQTLEDYVKEKGKLTEEETIHILRQLLSSLKYLHDLYICHRDITANNVLISSNGVIKIIDFNISRKLRSDEDAHIISSAPSNNSTYSKPRLTRLKSQSNLKSMLTPKGTIEYQAPEILMGSFYDQSVDMWSVGVLVYFCLLGYRPFYADMIRELVEQIINCNYVIDENVLSYESVRFIKNCLTKYSIIRMSSKEALVHPWIKKIKITDNIRYKSKMKTICIPKSYDDHEIVVKKELITNPGKLRKSSSDDDLTMLE